MKKLMVLLLALAMLFTVSACKGSGNNSGNSENDQNEINQPADNGTNDAQDDAKSPRSRTMRMRLRAKMLRITPRMTAQKAIRLMPTMTRRMLTAIRTRPKRIRKMSVPAIPTSRSRRLETPLH